MYHIIIIVILIWCVQNSNGRPKQIIIIINSSFVTRSKYSQITDTLRVCIKTTKHKKEKKKIRNNKNTIKDQCFHQWVST